MANKKRRNIKNIAIYFGLLFILLTVCGIRLYNYLSVVTPNFEKVTYELGEAQVSEDVADYITAKKFMLNKVILDTSDVDTTKVGNYVVSCTVKDKNFNYFVDIVDTTSPVIIFADKDNVYATEHEYNVNDFASTQDLSQIDKFEILSVEKADSEEELDNSRLVFEEPGVYIFTIISADVYGNETIEAKDIEVVEAPHFQLLADREYKLGNPYALLDFVYAEDRFGNNITDKIEVIDDDNYDANTQGDYTVVYKVVDAENIDCEKSIDISVGEYKQNIYGFEDEEDYRKILVENDYFKYETLRDNDDEEAVLNLTSPASFNIKSSNSMASAFLFKVTDHNAYFITNKHAEIVIDSDFTVFDYLDKSFNVWSGDIEMFRSPDKDVMVFKVPISRIPLELLFSYKEVAVDWNIYETHEHNDKLLVNTQHFTAGAPARDIYKTVTLNQYNQSVFHDFQFKYAALTTNEVFMQKGMSGSPLFDYNGYLNGIATSTWKVGDAVTDAYLQINDIKNLTDTINFD